MFIPNMWAEVRDPTGYSVRSAVPTFAAPVPRHCALVRLRPKAQKTSVRADASATRGGTDEIAGDGVMLFEKAYEPLVDAIVTVNGTELRVLGVEPRYAVTGELDHYQATLEYWGGK